MHHSTEHRPTLSTLDRHPKLSLSFTSTIRHTVIPPPPHTCNMFAAKNPFEDIVTNATSDELTAENWELNLEVCDKVSSGGESA